VKDIPKKLGIKETDFRLVFGGSQIDYDQNKEAINRKKHGYSLESAVYLLERWLLPTPADPFITSDPIREGGEIRHQHMGIDDAGNVVFMVTTMRADETVRVISFRRASNEEREVFLSLTDYIMPKERTP
jgi:uncharacterized DUF497 family protein